MSVSQATLPALPRKERLPKIMYVKERHASRKTGIEVKPSEQVQVVSRLGKGTEKDWVIVKNSAGKVIYIPLAKLTRDNPAGTGEPAFQDYGANWMGGKILLSFDEIFQEPLRLGWVKKANMTLEASLSASLWEKVRYGFEKNKSILLSGISNSTVEEEQRFFIFEKQAGVEEHFIPIRESDVKVAGVFSNIELQYDARNRYDQEIIALITGWLRFFNAREKQEHRLGVSMVNRMPIGIASTRKEEGDLLLLRFEIRMKDGSSKSFYCAMSPKLPTER